MLTLLIGLLCPIAWCAEYFNHIGLAEGLTQPSVMAIHQDRLGRMWFGTREGINRYDGSQITVFKGWIQATGNTPAIWLGNEVHSITEDDNGNLYFLIEDEIIRYDLYKEQFARLPQKRKISALHAAEGHIWYIGNDSLFCYETKSSADTFVADVRNYSPVRCLNVQKDRIYIGTLNGILTIDRHSQQADLSLKGIEVYRIFESARKELWIGTRMDGLYRKLPTDIRPVKVPYQPGSPEGISSEQIRNFVEDDEGNIWFGTFDGLHKYDASTHRYSLIQIPRYIGGLNHPSVFALYKDVQGTIWIGSYFGGVNYFSPRRESFMHYDYGENVSSQVYYSYIGDLAMDCDGNLWFGTDGGGISCTDREWNLLKHYTASDKRGNSVPHNNIKGLCYNPKEDCLYIATYLGGLSRYDRRTERFHNYLKANGNTDNSPNEVVFHIKMWKDNLYLSARNGVFRLDTRTQQFTKLPVPPAYYEHFDIDEEGHMYLVEWHSILQLDLTHPDSIMRIPLEKEEQPVNPTRVLATTQGIYVGTLGAGLLYYDHKTRQLSRYTTENSRLSGNYCYNLCQTESGRIIITADKGVSCLDPDKESFAAIDFRNNFPSAHIINGCGIYTDGKNIFIGDTKGVTVFTEDEFDKTDSREDSSRLYFSELWVNNQRVTPDDGTNILSQALPYTDRLRLRHTQNNLIIRFALSDFGQQLSEKWFLYRLDGFDKDWIRTKQTELHYTNLDPGKYTLRIARAGNPDEENAAEISMQLVIRTPWYNTWWAWAIYIIAFGACVSYYIYSRIAERTLALSLQQERFEKQQIEQVNHEKLVFFTNVSHEFRTPLTLIMSHTDMLLQNHALNPQVSDTIRKIQRNSQQMNNLISELLEFRKLEQNHETLCLRKLDIMAFLREIFLSFSDHARRRNIDYTCRLPQTPLLCRFDPKLMERVFFNLLSNAFKYTNDGKSVSLRSEVTNEEIRIHITDTGIGIPEKDIERIFARFYRSTDNERERNLFSGTGIGLALTRSIVEKHHGSIGVRSTVGRGSTFTVSLPRRESVFEGDANVRLEDTPDKPKRNNETPVADVAMPLLTDAEAENGKAYTLLLVEDNEELLQVLRELFSPFYHTVLARNGYEGLNKVRRARPDLVISDIMMPEMSGTEMCLQIKNNIDTCHIPVILLTALDSTEQNIEGLNRGADDYVTKPFHPQLLLARANNLIRNRLLMQHQFEKKPLSEIDLTSINPMDKELLKQVTDTIEQHIDDSNFDIIELCKEIGMGRSLLYKKFKGLTGMTPNNFLLNCRLKHAATMIRQYPEMPVAEVGDRCGFSTPAYFSRCFKAQYGCTPQQYKKETKNPS